MSYVGRIRRINLIIGTQRFVINFFLLARDLVSVSRLLRGIISCYYIIIIITIITIITIMIIIITILVDGDKTYFR